MYFLRFVLVFALMIEMISPHTLIAQDYSFEKTRLEKHQNQIIQAYYPIETQVSSSPIIAIEEVEIKPVSVEPIKKIVIINQEPAPVQTFNGSCFDYVATYAQKYNIDASLLRRIIKAESGGNPNSKNSHSTASGCGQFIKGTWAGTLKQMGRAYESPFNPDVNVEAMAFKIAHGGIAAWNASRHAWGN